MSSRSPVRALVSLDAIASNYRLIRDRVGPARAVYAVVKADAYGHGATAVARRLAAEGVDRFAVAHTEEGVALRRAGVGGEILLLSHAEPSDLPRQRAYGLTPVLYDLAQARAVAQASAGGSSEPLRVHLELDTGMGRAGIRSRRARRDDRACFAASTAARSRGHVCEPLVRGRPVRRPRPAGRSARSSPASSVCARPGVPTGTVHAANSAGVLGHPDAWLDAVRPGLALYGVAPSPASGGAGLVPAMALETAVVAVKNVPAGTPLGYGGRFVARRDTTVAVIPIGYHDGFRRSLSGKISVLLRGQRAPVVGADQHGRHSGRRNGLRCGARRCRRVSRRAGQSRP